MTTQSLKKWHKVRLDEVADFQYGYGASAKEKDTGTKLLRITDIVPDLIDWETVPFCEITEKKIPQYKIEKGDILIARTGATAGYAKLIRKAPELSVFASYLIRLRMKDKSADPAFVGRIIESDYFKKFVTAHAGGSAQPHANAPVLKNFELLLPDLTTQENVVEILSAYDDVIENNARRIQILEQVAQAIYRESFVTPLENGSLPKGWEVSTLGEHLAELESGSRPKGGVGELKTGVPSVGAENINGIGRHDHASEKFIEKSFFEKMTRGIVKDRDVAIYKDGAYIGRSSYFRDGFPHKIFSVNEHVFLLRSSGERITQNFLYLWLREPLTIHAIRATNANAAQPGVNQSGIRGIKITLAPKEILKTFDNKVEPILAFIINLAKQNHELRKMRDLLLPKLTTGEINV